jgi:hypothetical protein
MRLDIWQNNFHSYRRLHIDLCSYLLTCLVTYSMEQSPSGEANRFAASQEIPRIFWNPKVHYRIHKCPPPVYPEPAQPSPRPTPKLKDYSLSAVRDCLFNIFAATLHIGGRSSIRNLKTRHAVVTGTHVSHGLIYVLSDIHVLGQKHLRSC